MPAGLRSTGIRGGKSSPQPAGEERTVRRVVPSMVTMTARSHWGMTPRESVEQECARRGERAVVSGCIAMLRGRPVDGELIMALGGPPADWVRTGGEPGPDYWLRVWAARGLLYAWHGSARMAVRSALADEAWRVREMALRVVATRELMQERGLVEAMRQDGSARVRAAAANTLRDLDA